jgi:hypothetical protein
LPLELGEKRYFRVFLVFLVVCSIDAIELSNLEVSVVSKGDERI